MSKRIHKPDRTTADLTIKLTYLLFLLPSPFIIVFLFLLPHLGYRPVLDPSSITAIIFDIGFTIAAVVMMLLGLGCIPGMIEKGQWPENENEKIRIFTKPLRYFLSSVLYGIFLCLVGSFWPVWVLITLSGIVGMILTYPSKKNMKKWEEWRDLYAGIENEKIVH